MYDWNINSSEKKLEVEGFPSNYKELCQNGGDGMSASHLFVPYFNVGIFSVT